jgi:DNA-binding response OmpR family regulator
MPAPTDNPVVLVVEDDPPVRDLLDDVLHEVGYEVVGVHDVRAAFQLMRTLQVDLVTLDLDLPGLPGSELLNMLQARSRAVPPVIIITSDTPVRLELRDKVQAVVAKPFDVDDLIAIIRTFLPFEGESGKDAEDRTGTL